MDRPDLPADELPVVAEPDDDALRPDEPEAPPEDVLADPDADRPPLRAVPALPIDGSEADVLDQATEVPLDEDEIR